MSVDELCNTTSLNLHLYLLSNGLGGEGSADYCYDPRDASSTLSPSPHGPVSGGPTHAPHGLGCSVTARKINVQSIIGKLIAMFEFQAWSSAFNVGCNPIRRLQR
jgi:hypothetical protein